MNVLMVSPAFPAEMPLFTRGLAGTGATVIGLGEQSREMLPPGVRGCLAAYLQVPSLWDESAVVARVENAARQAPIDRVECLWEPGMLLAARIREALGLPGMTVEETAEALDRSPATVKRDWTYARAWLFERMTADRG